MRYLLFCGVMVLLMLTGCEGMLPRPDDFEPTGSEFNLNNNLLLVSLTGMDQGFPATGTYPLRLKLRSRSQNYITDTLPAGLLFRSVKRRVQHVICLKPHIVGAGPTEQELMIGVFCCNERREMPRSADTFELGPLTDNPGLQEIVSLIRNKDISGKLWLVQRAVWMVTDSTGLTPAYRDSLSALPEGINSFFLTANKTWR